MQMHFRGVLTYQPRGQECSRIELILHIVHILPINAYNAYLHIFGYKTIKFPLN